MTSYESLFDLLARRRSIRHFTERSVSSETIEKLVEAAIQAPSASNRQDWKFLVVRSRKHIEALADTTSQCWKDILACCDSEAVQDELAGYAVHFDWFRAAPVVIAVTCKRPEGFLRELLPESASAVSGAYASAAMASQNLLLAAESLGLGACCLTGPVAAEKAFKPLLGMGNSRQLVCLVAVGYPAAAPSHITRKKAHDVIEEIT